MTKRKPLSENEIAVLKAIEPGYDVLLVIIPDVAKLGPWATGDALAELKKRGMVKFEGRGKLKTAHLTDIGELEYEVQA